VGRLLIMAIGAILKALAKALKLSAKKGVKAAAKEGVKTATKKAAKMATKEGVKELGKKVLKKTGKAALMSDKDTAQVVSMFNKVSKMKDMMSTDESLPEDFQKWREENRNNNPFQQAARALVGLDVQKGRDPELGWLGAAGRTIGDVVRSQGLRLGTTRPSSQDVNPSDALKNYIAKKKIDAMENGYHLPSGREEAVAANSGGVDPLYDYKQFDGQTYVKGVPEKGLSTSTLLSLRRLANSEASKLSGSSMMMGLDPSRQAEYQQKSNEIYKKLISEYSVGKKSGRGQSSYVGDTETEAFDPSGMDF